MPDTVLRLIQGLNSENRMVRYYSAKALQYANDERAFDALANALEKEREVEIQQIIGESLVIVSERLAPK